MREVTDWPPALTDSQTFRVAPAGSLPATLKRCGIYSTAEDARRYVSIVVDFQGRAWHAMITDISERLMHQIVATLKDHVGEPLTDLGNLHVVEGPAGPI